MSERETLMDLMRDVANAYEQAETFRFSNDVILVKHHSWLTLWATMNRLRLRIKEESK